MREEQGQVRRTRRAIWHGPQAKRDVRCRHHFFLAFAKVSQLVFHVCGASYITFLLWLRASKIGSGLVFSELLRVSQQ